MKRNIRTVTATRTACATVLSHRSLDPTTSRRLAAARQSHSGQQRATREVANRNWADRVSRAPLASHLSYFYSTSLFSQANPSSHIPVPTLKTSKQSLKPTYLYLQSYQRTLETQFNQTSRKHDFRYPPYHHHHLPPVSLDRPKKKTPFAALQGQLLNYLLTY